VTSPPLAMCVTQARILLRRVTTRQLSPERLTFLSPDAVGRFQVDGHAGIRAWETELARMLAGVKSVLPDPESRNIVPAYHSGGRQALEVVLAHRLHFGRCGPGAEELRTHAQAGNTVAERTPECHGEGCNLRNFRRGQTGSRETIGTQRFMTWTSNRSMKSSDQNDLESSKCQLASWKNL
jgi:hypothetical protein